VKRRIRQKLIWKLRNERVIDNPTNRVATPDEIRRKWLTAVNERLKFDCKMTNKTKYGKKALSSKRVLNTWKDTLENERGLSQDWVFGKVEVLVGIKPP